MPTRPDPSTEPTIERASTSPATTATVAEAARDGEDLHVVAHVERDPAGQEHGRERQADRERGEARELEAQAREEPQEQDGHEADAERQGRHGDGRAQHRHGYHGATR